MPAANPLIRVLTLVFLLTSFSYAFPSSTDDDGELYVRDLDHLVRRGNSANHNAAKEGLAKSKGQLPWNELECTCTVSEQHIPVLGDQGR